MSVAHPLTDQQQSIVELLGRYGPLSEYQIRSMLLLTPRGCAQTVGSLRRRGKIRRARDGVRWEAVTPR